MRMDRKVNIPFRTQQFIVVAARMGSFHKAAASLGVDHSLVVRSIDRLERDLGVKIFDRDRSHFAVTHAGSFFIREIMEAVDRVDRACDLARYRSQIDHGPLRLGYSAYIHSQLIPILERWQPSSIPAGISRSTSIESISAEWRLQLSSGATRQLIDWVSRGKLQAGFGIQPVLEEDLLVHPIAREAFCLCVSKNHRFAKQPSILIRDLDGEMVFFLPPGAHPAFYDQTVEYIHSTGARPVLREVLSLTHVMEIVTHNFGVALLPRSASHISHLGIVFKPIADKLLWIETAFFRRFDQRDERIPWFLNELQSQIKGSSLGQ
jgi:DNA-binding transcriptional LysR family regulator